MKALTKEDMYISIRYVSTIPISELIDDIIKDDTIGIVTLIEVHKEILKLIKYLSNVRSK